MSEQQLQQLVERVAARATMPPTHVTDDERRGRAALGRRRREAVVLVVAASVAVVAGGLALGGPDDPRESVQRPTVSPPSVTPTATPDPGTAAALGAAVAAAMDPTGERIVPVPGSSAPVERGGHVVLVTTKLGWQEEGRSRTLPIGVRVAASAPDAEWGCEDRCELRSYDVGGLVAWTTTEDDLGRTSTLLVRADGSAVALDVPRQLLSSGAVTRADIDRALTSPDVTLPPATPTGPSPIPGELVDRIAADALPGLEVTAPSGPLHPAGRGLWRGAEVLWQADPVSWAEGTCFWSRRCDVEIVDGTRLELSRSPQGSPSAGYVSVEHHGPVWRTRVLVPEGAVSLGDLVPLLTDERWPH